MTDKTAQDLIDALDDLLEEERTALKAGDLAALEPILAKKEELIDALNEISEAEDSQPEDFTDVQSKVSRNQDLLQNAMLGIKAVSSRMAELRKVRRGLEVYDQRGQRNSFHTNNQKKLEKRA